MEVKLVVANGKNAGQTIPIVGPKFLIGRAEDCQLRPRSDVISRYHCVLLVEEAFVAVRDFGSKNGTYVNGEQIMGEQELKNGDRLRVGQLEFDVELSVEVGGRKKPKIEGIQDAVARTVEAGSEGEFDLSDWLGQEDSSGTVLGILPLRRATTLGGDTPPDTAADAKDHDEGSDSPKK